MDDLLDDWQASFQPPFEGIRIVGHRWSPRFTQVRDFLARNSIPYQVLDVEVDETAVSRWESGARPLTPTVLARLAKVFKCETWEVLVDRDGLRRLALRGREEDDSEAAPS